MTHASTPPSTALEARLRDNIAGDVRFDTAARVLYSTDAGNHQVFPLGVVCPARADDVVAAVSLCAEHGVPVVPRGGGSGLAGQAIGSGVVIDFSKHMDALLDVDPASLRVSVQPGMVLGLLNRKLAPHGLQFGPDPASAERATIGGIIGTNATGAHSIRYGMTADHVVALKAVLADGSRADFGPQGEAPAAGLAGSVAAIVRAHEPAIRRDFPKVWRRASGYNVDYLAEMLAYDPANPGACLLEAQARRGPLNLVHHLGAVERFNLAPLLVGSEGTLGVVTEATLKLVPKPRRTALVLAVFDALDAAMEAVPALLETDPAAVELLDELLLTLGRDIPDIARRMTWLTGRPEAVLVVEYAGDSEAEVADGVARARALAARERLPCALVPLLDAASQADLWFVRKAGQNIYYSMRSERKPISVVEDVAVPVERLVDFVRRLRQIFADNGTTGGFYAHASAGVLHVRPLVNLKTTDGVRAMDDIGRKALALCRDLGGAMSGEHGDGYQRTVWNDTLFGGEVYACFCAIKDAFDPNGVLNPDKKVRGKDPLQSLRFGPEYRSERVETVFHYQRDGSFGAMIDQCNGNGDCRKLAGGVMCPSYRATRDEAHSTRGRANLLRGFITARAPSDGRPRPSAEEVREALSLCLSCKACENECATQVDMAKLKSDFMQAYHDRHGLPLRAWALGRIAALSALGAPFAPLANRVMRSGLFKRALDIAPERALPALAERPFDAWWRSREPRPPRGSPVVLFVDTFARFNHPEIAIAAVNVLERLGFDVTVPPWMCCGRPLLSQGQPRAAFEGARFNVAALAPHARRGVPILGLEPSCISALKDDYLDLVPGEDAEVVAGATTSVEAFVAGHLAAGHTPSSGAPSPVLFHGHCHQKAVYGTSGTLEALRRAGYAVGEIDATCCGMAGAFGYETEHYAVSRQVGELALLPAVRGAAPDALIVAPGTSCRQQIEDLAGRRAIHPIQAIALVLDQESPTP